MIVFPIETVENIPFVILVQISPQSLLSRTVNTAVADSADERRWIKEKKKLTGMTRNEVNGTFSVLCPAVQCWGNGAEALSRCDPQAKTFQSRQIGDD